MTKTRLNWIISGLDWDLLSPWEEKFVESIEKYFKKHDDLTDSQEEIIERIYREKIDERDHCVDFILLAFGPCGFRRRLYR
jgi:hypothetical protein